MKRCLIPKTSPIEKQDSRANTTSEDARTALAWLQKLRQQQLCIAQSSFQKTVYTITDIRDFNNIAPNVVFGMEGMPGNQMEPDRGGLNLTTPENRTYGGADYMIAKVGGVWDALLGEGREFWNFANSDSHFEISDNRLYSSGYWPGQYAKNYTWVNGKDMQSVLNGMRSGKSFSVHGDLINALISAFATGISRPRWGVNFKRNKGTLSKLRSDSKARNKITTATP